VLAPSSLNGFYASSTPTGSPSQWIVAVIEGDLLVPSYNSSGAASATITSDQAGPLRFFRERSLCVGQWQGIDCEVWELIPEAALSDGFVRVELRSLLAQSGDAEFSLISRALQLLDWQAKNKFCGACGGPNLASETEHSFQCQPCQISQYPRISPCVIVAVVKDDKCLFARHPNWPVNRFSTLAGFIEAGESAEQALHREVFEEVGIEIENIRYVGSQAWPYPGQLMLGYIADAKTDEITIDGVEIAEANWHRYDQLPEVIAPPTIMAGRLIQQFILESKAKYG
jgi:NAD+ diphosphatase